MIAEKLKIRSRQRPVVPMKRTLPAMWPAVAVLVMIACYAVFFSAAALIRYRSFSFHDMDLAVINQNFYNASRGIFVSPELGVPALFSGHKWFIIFPLLPLYLLFPGPPLLLILQSLALALGAWAVFLLARDLVDPLSGLMLSACYLIYPALNFVNLFEFHPIAFATPLLLFAFYFYHRKRWGWFVLCVFLSLSVREDVAISVFALGFYAGLKAIRDKEKTGWKRWRWGLVPLVSSVAWFYICVNVIPGIVRAVSPVASPEMVESFFGWLGNTPGEILKTVITRPGMVISGVFIPPKIRYVWQLLAPVALLPVLSPSGLVMFLVSLTEGLLSERFTHFSIRYQYSSIITPMVFAAAALGLRNLTKWRPMRGAGRYPGVAAFIIALLAARSFGPLFILPAQIPLWRVTEEDVARQSMVNLIPPGAPVAATFEFTPKLSNRPQRFFFYHLYASSRRPDWAAHVPVMQERADYLLVDFNDWLTFYDFYTPGGDQSVYSFLREGNWELAATVNSLALFQRGGTFSAGVVEAVPPEEGGDFHPVPGLPGLEAGPARASRGEEFGFPVLQFSAVLRASRAPLPDILFVARLVNRADPEKVVQQFLMAPYRIYPPNRWRAGETVRLHVNILLPDSLPPDVWDLHLFGITRREGLRLPPEASAAFYQHFDTAMALNYLPRIWGVAPEQFLVQHQILLLPGILSAS